MDSTHSFDHEKLHVYQRSLEFISWLEDVLPQIPTKVSARDQLDRASTSIPLNIAEGNGKHTSRDRCKYFDSARGSALECAAALDVLLAKRLIANAKVHEGKQFLVEIVSMLVGLIRSHSPDRVAEDAAEYCASSEEELDTREKNDVE